MPINIGRRELIATLGSAAAWSLTAQAQTPDATKRIGVLSPYAESDKTVQAHLALFRSALEQLGWNEGHDDLLARLHAGPSAAALAGRGSCGCRRTRVASDPTRIPHPEKGLSAAPVRQNGRLKIFAAQKHCSCRCWSVWTLASAAP